MKDLVRDRARMPRRDFAHTCRRPRTQPGSWGRTGGLWALSRLGRVCCARGVKVPLLTSFEGYRADRIGRDLLVGLTVWAVLVPEALAYATIAGVSPVIGLYAAPAALLL